MSMPYNPGSSSSGRGGPPGRGGFNPRDPRGPRHVPGSSSSNGSHSGSSKRSFSDAGGDDPRRDGGGGSSYDRSVRPRSTYDTRPGPYGGGDGGRPPSYGLPQGGGQRSGSGGGRGAGPGAPDRGYALDRCYGGDGGRGGARPPSHGRPGPSDYGRRPGGPSGGPPDLLNRMGGFAPPPTGGRPSGPPPLPRPTQAPRPMLPPPPPPPAPSPPTAKKERKPDSASPPPFPDPARLNNHVVTYVDSLRRRMPPGTSRKKIPQVVYMYAPAPDADGADLVQCTLTLPAESDAATKVFVSAPAERVPARLLAATAALHELWRAGEVDDEYEADKVNLPPPPPPVARIDNIDTYPVKKPAFWDACEAELGKGLVEGAGRTWYPTLLTLPPLPADPAEASGETPAKPLRPLLVLTPVPLPAFSPLTPLELFPPYTTKAHAVKLDRLPPVQLSTAEHAMADHFTRRLLRAIMNRPFIVEEGHLLVHLVLPPTAALDAVDWDEVVEAQGEPFEPWQWKDVDALERQVKDAMTTGKSEFSRRHEVTAVRRDLSPLSSPDDSPREKEYSSILDYIKSTSTKFTGLEDEHQPLLEMRRLPMVRLHLRSHSSSDEKETPPDGAEPKKVVHEQKYIIPEMSYKSTLHLSTYCSALYLPSFFIRLGTLLQVYELKASLFGSTIREDVLLQAITTPGAALEQDYDELEYAGDVVLKVMSTTYLFAMFPKAEEAELSRRRIKLINNKFLQTKLIESGLTGVVQAKDHGVKTWFPLNLGRYDSAGSVKGENLMRDAVRDSKLVVLGDKVCADVVEALIFAAYETGGMAAAWTFCRIIKLPMPEIAAWADFAEVKLPPAPAFQPPPRVLDAARELQAQLKYQFKDSRLLHRALTREQNGDKTSFQRLEFLGDAVLDLLAIKYLRGQGTHGSIGEMVLFKSSIVSNVALSALCVEIGLYRILQLEAPTIWARVQNYASQMQAAQRQEVEAAAAEKRPLKIYWADLDAPKETGDIIEAIIGGLMVDGGYSGVEPYERFFNNVYRPFLDRFINGLHSLPIRPPDMLMQIVGGRRCKGLAFQKSRVPTANKSYKQLEKTDVRVHNTVIGSCTAESDNHAMRQACLSALTAIEADPGLLARICTCDR